MNSRVAVVIIFHKHQLSATEQISLVQCQKILRNRDIFFLIPGGMDTRYLTPFLHTDVKIIRIKDKFLTSLKSANRFRLSPNLYKLFKQYEFMLIHELDAFIFTDNLDAWCDKNFDFIGAPWTSKNNSEVCFSGVGNGGFSLRKVRSHIDVLNSFAPIIPYSEVILHYYKLNWKGKLAMFPDLLSKLTIKNNTFWLFNDFQYNDDIFWGSIATKFNWFKVPRSEDALKFSFEKYPRDLFEINGHELPTGCHAWEKYDLNFWKPFIERFGHHVPGT